MAGNVCPSCNSPLDLARAPVARVRGAKVLAFCSPECADKGEQSEEAPDEHLSDGDPRPEVTHSDEEERDYHAVPVRPRTSRRRKIIALSAAIMAGGMLITIINAVSPSTPSDVSAAGHLAKSSKSSATESKVAATTMDDDSDLVQTGSETSPAGPTGEAAASATATGGDSPVDDVTPEVLYQRAQDTLREFLDSPSGRIKRIAAMALSRAGDSDSIAHLSELLENSNNDLVRVDAAYGLARTGDQRGVSTLVEGLRDKRRDVRVDSARSLVQLGGDQGNKTLRRMLSLRTHHLGAAELLAQRSDRDGTNALKAALADDESSEETRMRALVAMGRAGDASVRDQLLAILKDGRYMVGAADALAVLGDQAAVEPLTRQLSIASLRVRAAIALRKLGVTPAPSVLQTLAEAMSTGPDQARISAAEAALLLTGPEELAEFK